MDQSFSVSTISHGNYPYEARDLERKPEKLFKRGEHYATGLGFPPDQERATALYQLSADRGYLPAAVTLIFRQMVSENLEPDELKNNVICLQKAVDEGCSAAMLCMGRCLYRGLGIEKNREEALNYYNRAADLGDLDGAYEAAKCTLFGKGTIANPAQAIPVLQELASLNHPLALNLLACCYEEGLGTTQDLNEALVLLKKAADMGDSDACNKLGGYYLEGIAVAQDLKQAAEYFHRSARLKNPEGMANLAFLYEMGEGVALDSARHFSLLREASKLGDSIADNELEEIEF